jgi:hypothetical protein
MKIVKIVLAGGCVLSAVLTLQAQNYYLATQQAKRASTQNAAEQQRIANAAGTPGAPAAGSAPASAAPTDPALQATLKNIASLQGDFAAIIAAADKPDPAQKVSLLNNLTQAAQGSSKASSDSVKRVADDLLTAVAGKSKLVAAQQTKLAREVHALFNSSHLTATQQQNLLADVQKTLVDAGVSLGDAVNVATDLKAVVAETK